jgi:hypothetical protein
MKPGKDFRKANTPKKCPWFQPQVRMVSAIRKLIIMEERSQDRNWFGEEIKETVKCNYIVCS